MIFFLCMIFYSNFFFTILYIDYCLILFVNFNNISIVILFNLCSLSSLKIIFLKLWPGLMTFKNKNGFPLYIGFNLLIKFEVQPSNTHISNKYLEISNNFCHCSG